MKVSNRKFCLAPDDTLYRMSSALSGRLFSNPASTPITSVARQTLRCADVSVEVQGQRPIRVISMIRYVMQFDEHGVLDRDSLLRHWVDHQGSALSISSQNKAHVEMAATAGNADAAWEPSPTLTKLIHEAALGIVKATQLR